MNKRSNKKSKGKKVKVKGKKSLNLKLTYIKYLVPLLFSVIILLLIASLAISILFSAQAEEVSKTNEDMHSIVYHIQSARQAAKDFVITTEQDYIKGGIESLRKINEIAQENLETAYTDDLRVTIASIDRATYAYITKVSFIRTLTSKDARVNYINDELVPFEDTIEELTLEALEETKELQAAVIARNQIVNLFITILILTLSIIIIIILVMTLNKNTKLLTNGLIHASEEDDLITSIQIKTKNEFRDIAAYVNAFIENLLNIHNPLLQKFKLFPALL